VLGSDEAPEKSFETGEEVTDEVWESEMNNNAAIAPDGRELHLIGSQDGARYRISFTAREPGIYRLKNPSTQAYAVNLPSDESDLRQADLEMLKRRSGEDDRVHFVEGVHDFNALNTGRPLFHYFVLAGMAWLLAELAAQLLFKKLAS
jgi:hypothetical protein